uniref:Transmembrane protein 200B n=1 Tax=Strix occidentalis caurina TaxID=311401 RepID=A0A8D0G0F2_STROC
MTAESAETNGPMREPEAGVTKPPVPPAPPRRRGRRLRHKSPPEVPVKGQLRMRSPSGAFVMVGISVVLVGMTIAVVGYWPHRGPGGTGASMGNASIAGDMRREVAAGRHVPHSEKLKLIGPVIMGIGLFIFICANTMLYENRDMETRRLMQKGLYCMAGGLPEGSGPEDGHCQHGDSQPVPKANAECQHPPPPPSSASAPAPPPRPTSASPATLEPSPSSPRPLAPWRCPSSSSTTLHIPGHSKSLDLGRPGVLLVAPIKDRKNRSWPRLDHISLVGYAKLESTGESSDRLLEPSEPPSQGEPRPSSWVVGVEQGAQV